jgi:hypothetical protein
MPAYKREALTSNHSTSKKKKKKERKKKKRKCKADPQ